MKYRWRGEQTKLLSKHLESIHSQTGSRGWRETGGGRHEKKNGENDRVRNIETETRERKRERERRERTTFFLLKLIKYGPGLLKTQGLPEYWSCAGLGHLWSLLHCTLHCPAKAASVVLTLSHTHTLSHRNTQTAWFITLRLKSCKTSFRVLDTSIKFIPELTHKQLSNKLLLTQRVWPFLLQKQTFSSW